MNIRESKLKILLTIGICGGSASGKTTVAKRIISELGVPWVIILSLDSFYKVFTALRVDLQMTLIIFMICLISADGMH